MNDILDDPRAWAEKAAGTPLRLLVLICLHASLLVLGYALDLPAFFAVGGLALPALYLYALYRLSKSPASPDHAHDDRVEQTGAGSTIPQS